MIVLDLKNKNDTVMGISGYIYIYIYIYIAVLVIP